MTSFKFAWSSRYLMAAFVVLLAGCSGDSEKAYVERSVQELYNSGMDLLEKGDYTEAADAFDDVDRQHPYSKWATRAQVMSAYAYYKGQKYDRVIAALESFTQLHPAHEDVPYALYLTGLSYYEQIGPATRDQQDARSALRTFTELRRRFPQTSYGKNAKYKIDLLKSSLAGKEMEVGRFYLAKKAYQAAINRFQLVATRYQTTEQVEEALYRMVECYLGMGLKAEARKSAAVLGHNYTGSPWYAEAYALVGGDKEPKTSRNSFDSQKKHSWKEHMTKQGHDKLAQRTSERPKPAKAK